MSKFSDTDAGAMDPAGEIKMLPFIIAQLQWYYRGLR